jgi:hypothetical protein
MHSKTAQSVCSVAPDTKEIPSTSPCFQITAPMKKVAYLDTYKLSSDACENTTSRVNVIVGIGLLGEAACLTSLHAYKSQQVFLVFVSNLFFLTFFCVWYTFLSIYKSC